MAVLPDAGLADQHRIVLGAAAQDLHDAADFLVAADDRIELAAARLFGQIDGVAFQRLIFRFRDSDRSRAACRAPRPEPSESRRDWRPACSAGCRRDRTSDPKWPSSKMLGRDILVLEILRFLERGFENLVQGGRNVHARTAAR